MTTAEVLAVLWRRWYVVLLGLLVTAYVLHGVRDARPVYWTQAEVALVNPPNPEGPNELTGTSKSLIAMAGLVVADVQERGAQPAVSDRVDLPGLGVRDGWEVRLPNAGGQWEPDFNRAVVNVQVVAPTAQAASARLDELVTRVRAALNRRQEADGISPRARIRSAVSVDHLRVVELSGSQTRAQAMVLLVGMGGTLLAASAFDALRRRIRAMRRPRPGGSGSGPDGGAIVVPDVAVPDVSAA